MLALCSYQTDQTLKVLEDINYKRVEEGCSTLIQISTTKHRLKNQYGKELKPFVAECINEQTLCSISNFRQCGFAKHYENDTISQGNPASNLTNVHWHTLSEHKSKKKFKRITMRCDTFKDNGEAKDLSWHVTLGMPSVDGTVEAERDKKKRQQGAAQYGAENMYAPGAETIEALLGPPPTKKRKRTAAGDVGDQVAVTYLCDEAKRMGAKGEDERKLQLLLAEQAKTNKCLNDSIKNLILTQYKQAKTRDAAKE